MVSHMKTTIDIPDVLMKDVKRVADRRGVTLKEIIQTSLRNFLTSQRTASRPFKLRWHTFRGKGLVRGLTEGDWPEIRRRAYEGRGG